MTAGRPADGGWRRSALFTDLYQLVMAELYMAEGIADQPAQFDYFYRSNPDYGTHQAGYCVFAGLDPLLAWMRDVSFDDDDLAVLSRHTTPTGAPRFSGDFLSWLSDHGNFRRLQVRGVPEGRVVHPHAPILTVTGPLAVAQLLETALLNQCNYPTLIATKAARMAEVAEGGDVIEFGMRRGPGSAVDDAARAALIGGCRSTSNVQAAADLGVQPRGTHAHSMVQAYLATGATELDAFRAFARRNPDECVLLVDTIDTLSSGVPNAITTFEELRAEGHRPAGVRLDSGDLAHLAVETARMLDGAGFSEVRIVLSGELDELTMWQVLTQIDEEARAAGVEPGNIRRRLSYGVGTRLITSAGSGALGGVYKLTAIQDAVGEWQPAVKLSENPIKVPIVGPKRHWRLYDERRRATADLLTEADEIPFATTDEIVLHHPSRADLFRRVVRHEVAEVEEMHVELFRDGETRTGTPSVEQLQARCRADLDRLDRGVRRLINPHRYHVSLSERLHERQHRTIEHMRRGQ